MRSGDLISIQDVSAALSMSRVEAAKLLARWNAQGWVKRLRRGYYAPVPLASTGQDQILEDPWVMVPELFGPAYIGGWSAAEHWGLPISLKHVPEAALFGTRPVWRGQARVMVSSPAKTIVDMLDDPAIGGGIWHVAECLSAYLARTDASPGQLISTAEKLGNGAVFKRLGYLAEREGKQEMLVAACHARRTAGNAKLDLATACRKVVKRWRLWCPRAGWRGSVNDPPR